MTLPVICTFDPPRNAGTMKLPSAGMKTMTDPPAMPGAVSGRITRRNVCNGDAPRSCDACTRDQSSLSMLA